MTPTHLTVAPAASTAVLLAVLLAACGSPESTESSTVSLHGSPPVLAGDAPGAEAISPETRAILTAAMEAAEVAGDPRTMLDAVSDRAAGVADDQRRQVAIALERRAAGLMRGEDRTNPDARAAAVPALPGWFEALAKDATATATATATPTARGSASDGGRRDRSLPELLAEVAPPEGDVGPQPRVRQVEPGARAAAADRLERARAARAEGRLLRAITDLREAAEFDPASVAVRRELARSYELIGNADLARRTWQDLIALRPGDAEATVALAVDAVTAGRPLAALAILRPGLESADGASVEAAAAAAELAVAAGEDVASIFAFSRDLILLQVCEALGADAAAAEVAEAMAASPPDEIGRRAAGLRGLEAAPAEILRRLGDANVRRGRLNPARAAYARAEAELGPVLAGSREEQAALLVRRVALELMAGRRADAWAAIGRAAAADPSSPAPAAIGLRIAGSSGTRGRESVDERGRTDAVAVAARQPAPAAAADAAALAAVAFRSTSDAIAAATDRRVEPAAGTADGPSPRRVTVADQLEVSGPPWPHPLPGTADAAARILRRLDRPLTASSDLAVSPAERAMVLEACGWLGRAWSVLDPAAAIDPAIDAAIDPAIDPAARDPRTHIARVRIAGLMRDRAALREAVSGGIAAGLGSPALAEFPGLTPVAEPAAGTIATDAWRAVFGSAAAAALARTHQVDEAVQLAGGLVAWANDPAADVVLDPLDRSALDLTRAAALAERAWTSPFGPQRREDLRTAIGIAAGILEERPGDGLAWRFLDRLLAPTGPVADGAARARHRRQWAAAVAGDGGRDAAALRRQGLIAAGRHDAADDAARLRLLVDPGDDAAVEDLLVSRSRAGRIEDALAWIIERLERHPADPAAAAARLRLDVTLGRTEDAWDRLERRLDRDPDDLVALRLAESAAGYAGNRMMRLVMGETRLLQRPPSPTRALMLARLAIDAGQDADAIRSAAAFVSMLEDAAPRDVLTLDTTLGQVGRGDADRAAAVDEIQVDLATGLARADGFLDDPVARGLAVALRREGLSPRAIALIDALARRSEGVLAGEPPGPAAPSVALTREADRPGPSSAGNGDPVIEPWRTIAVDLVDRGHADRAAVAVARRILAGAEAGGRLDAFVALFIALDAAAVAGAGEPPPAGVVRLRDPLAGAGASVPPTPSLLELAGLPTEDRPGAERDLTRPLLARLAEDGRIRAFAAGDGTGDADEPGADLLGLALRRAAGVHRLVGRADVADAILAGALERRPDDPDILNDLGYTRLVDADGPDPAAAAMIERAHAADPGNASILDSLGWLRYLQGVIDGDPGGEDALTLIEDAVARDPRPGGEVLLHLGDVRWRAGSHVAAVEAWRRGAAAVGTAEHRASTEQQMRTLQIGVWGVLVRDPADMYDALFAAVGSGLRARLAAIERGGDPGPDSDPPIVSTYAERDAER